MSFIDLLKKNKHDGKDTSADKAFMSSIAISFFAIIICIILLSASTFAWFSTTVESENSISTSVYKLVITKSEDGGAAVPLDLDEKGNFVFTAAAGETYTITVATDDSTTGNTGYIKLCTDKMAEGEALYSEQIDRNESISFDIKFTDATEVTIIECWGISSKPDAERVILNDSKLNDLQPEGNN